MKPDRRQALKAGVIAPPLRGFGLDRLPPARRWHAKQNKVDCERGRAPIPERRSSGGAGEERKSSLKTADLPLG
jgi:hypothetical protein